MIQPNDFRFTLTIDDVEHILQEYPEQLGFNEFSYKRDLNYWAVLRKYATDIELFTHYAKLIRQKYYESGTDGIALLKIEALNRSTWKYFEIYSGEIDLSTIEDQLHSVSANLIDGGLFSKFNAYKNVVYDIPFDEQDPEVILPFAEIPNWFETNGYLEIPASVNANVRLVALNAEINNTVQNLRNIVGRSQIEADYLALSPTIINTRKLFQYTGANTQGTIKGYLNLRIRILTSAGRNEGASIILYVSNGTTWEFINLYNTRNDFNLQPWSGAVVVNKRIEFDSILNMKTGFSYVLLSRVNNEAITSLRNDIRIDVLDSSITIYQDIPVDANRRVMAKKPKRLLSQILEKMNGSPVSVSSPFLDTWENLLITSGDGIRGISNAAIKTSFDDFFESMNAIQASSFDVKLDEFIFGSKTDLFTQDVVHVFEDVVNPVIKPLTEIMFSSIDCGYNKEDYDIEKGRFEVNQGQVYTTPNIRVQSKLPLKSTYRADQYGVDTIRIAEINKLINSNDTDKTTDNDTFFISSKKTANGIKSVFQLFFDWYNLLEPLILLNRSFTMSFYGHLETFTFVATPNTSGNQLPAQPSETNIDTFLTNLVTYFQYNQNLVDHYLIGKDVSGQSIFLTDRYATNEDIEITARTTSGVQYIEVTQGQTERYVPINKSDFYSVIIEGEGIPKQNIMNLDITPKRNLMRSIDFIKSAFRGDNETGVLTFQSADKFTGISTQRTISSPVIKEGTDIDMNSYDKLFDPVLLTFETRYNSEMFDRLSNHSNGLYQVNIDDNKKLYGYIYSIDIIPDLSGKTTVSLIIAPNSDLSVLIN